MRLLPFVPALVFGLVAVVFSALALRDDQMKDREEVVARSRLATQVAVIAAVLCALALLIGGGLLILQVVPNGD